MNSTSTGYCNCCATTVRLLTSEIGESICSICRSYDVTRRTLRMTREELRSQRLHDLANIFESAFGGAQ